MAIGIDNISPFCIHPDVETMYSLDEFGCCFVINGNADDDIAVVVSIFCNDTPLSVNDFQVNYIYFGQYLFTTEKQDVIREHSDVIYKNIKSSAWDLYTVFHIPEVVNVTQPVSRI